MKVLHIVPGLSPRSGGPTRSISGLCRALAETGVDTTLFIHDPRFNVLNPGKMRVAHGRGRSYAYVNTKRIIADLRPDLVHMHGLWMWPNHMALKVITQKKLPVVLSLRGMLDPWALKQKQLKKKLAMLLYQRNDLKKYTVFHATAQEEANNIKAQHLSPPIWVIPNGVDVPETLPELVPRVDGRRIALFLSRLHPGKGLIELLQAWNKIRPQGWKMRIVGPDVCGHKAVVQSEIARLGLHGDFEFVSELDDQQKWQEYVNADLFIHPSHSENFGISIAEALAAGVPVITTKGTPWQELQGSLARSEVLKCESSLVGEAEDGRRKTEDGRSALARHCDSALLGNPEDRGLMKETGSDSTNGLTNSRTHELVRSGRAGWWIDIGVEPLAEALREAMNLSDEERRSMGENGRKLVNAKYTWPMVAEQMKAAYAWILNGGEKPDCVNIQKELVKNG